MPTGAEVAVERVVLDASAAYLLLLDPGDRGERLAARLRNCTLEAPALLPFELTNVLRRSCATGRLPWRDGTLALDEFRDLRVTLWPFATVENRVWELGGSITAYDGSYVALAELLDAALVTGDTRLSRSNGARCVIEIC
jgi:predicted nucleic acid-binding protein